MFKELVKNTNKVKGKKKREEIPSIYHIVFDEANGMLRTIAGDHAERAFKTVDDEVYVTDLKGNGTVHFAMGFPEIMNALTGEIELHALDDGPLPLDKGPLYIMKNSETVKIRYLIPPAKVDRD